MSDVEIGKLDLTPGDDWLRRNQGALTHPVLVIDPGCRSARIRQDTGAAGEGIPSKEYHGLVVTATIPTGAIALDEAAVRTYLSDGEGQTLLQAVCDGHGTYISYRGGGPNLCGNLSDEAQEILEQLVAAITDLPSIGEVWDESDWAGSRQDWDITAATTDEEIETLAAEGVEDAITNGAIINHDALVHILKGWRDEMTEDES